MEDARPLARFQVAAAAIRKRISEGAYPIGSRLPSIDALGAELGVSHMTVKQALATLADEGLIASRRGVTAEVIGLPREGIQPVPIAERLARLESAIQLLDQRVSAIENHDSHPTGDAEPQP